MSIEVIELTERVANSSQEAMIRAIRWDLLASGLVLDLDVRVEWERGSAMVTRGWLVFVDHADLAIDVTWGASFVLGASILELTIDQRPESGRSVVRITTDFPSGMISLTASRTLLLRSDIVVRTSLPSLGWDDRQSLASDAALRAAVVRPGLD